MGAIRTNDSYLQALYRRQRSRIGHGKAIGAVKHSIICACWHMLTTGELYREAAATTCHNATPERATRRLIAARTPWPHRQPGGCRC